MWAEELTRPYHTLVTDLDAKLRSAAELLLKSEHALRHERSAEGLRIAEQCLTAFQKSAHPFGHADAARLVAYAMCLQDRRKEVDRLLKDELARFPASAQAEARLLLAIAEVNADRRGQKNREQALLLASQVRAMAASQKDEGLEASALLTMTQIFLKYKGDKETSSKEATRLAKQAHLLFDLTDDLRGKAMAKHWTAVAQCRRSNLEAAIMQAQLAVDLWKQIEDLILEGNELQYIAEWHLSLQRPHKAVIAGEQALEMFMKAEVGGGREITALQVIVKGYIANGEPFRALWISDDAVARFQQRHDKSSEALALLLVAEAYLKSSPSTSASPMAAPYLGTEISQTPPPEAVAAAERALLLARETNDSTVEAKVLARMSELGLQGKGSRTTALALQDSASTSIKQVSSLQREVSSLLAEYEAMFARKDFQLAERVARQALALCREAKFQKGEADALLSIAKALQARQEVEESVALAKEAQTLFHEVQDRLGEAQCLQLIAEVRTNSGQHEGALHAADRARELFQRFGHLESEAKVLTLTAEVRSLLLESRHKKSKAPLPWEDLAKAAKNASDAAKLTKQLGDRDAEASSLGSLARVHLLAGRLGEAVSTAENSMSVAVEARNVKFEASALLIVAEVYLQEKHLQKALKAARQAELIYSHLADSAGLARAVNLLDDLREFEFRVDETAATAEALHRSSSKQIQYAVDTGEIKARIQQVTKLMVGSQNDVHEDMPLMEIGINSMNAVLFRNKLTTEFPEIDLPVTLVFDYPTVRSLSELAIEKERTRTSYAVSSEPLSSQLAVSPGFGTDLVRNKIQEVTRGMVGSDRDIDVELPLMEIGINSMNAVLFRNKLGNEFSGLSLPSTLVFDYPTIKAMTELFSSV